MTGRDRLLKLVCTDIECDRDCSTCEYRCADDECVKHYGAIMVDFFLANGVIVPPVKLGDVVYLPSGGSKDKPPTIYEKQVIGLHIIGEDLRIRRKNRATESYVILRSEFGDVYHVPMAKLGKAFFLTREGAARAAQQTTKGEDRDGKDENLRKAP